MSRLLNRRGLFTLAALHCGLLAAATANAADVSGKVTTATGAPVANIPVVLGSPTTATTNLLKGITNATGAYTISGVAPGSYQVAPAKPGTYFTPNTRTVSVASTNLANVDFQVAGADAVRPTVTIKSPAAAPNNSYANLATVNGEAVDATSGVLSVGVTLSRRESATAPAAVYNWRDNRWDAGAVIGINNTKLATLTVGAAGKVNWSTALPATLARGTYVLGATAVDKALNTSTPAAAIFNITGGIATFSIGGRITNAAGVGQAGVRVVLANSADVLTSPSLSSVFSRTTDASGNFSFPGFTAGLYVVAPLKPGSYFLPNFRAVAVGRANVTNVNFQLAGTDLTKPLVAITTPAAAPNNVYTTLATASGTASDPESGIVGVAVTLTRPAAGTVQAGAWNWRLNAWSVGLPNGPDFIKPATISLGANGVANWSIVLPRTALVNGNYQLAAIAANKAALLSAPAGAAFTIGTPVRTFAVSGKVATSAGAGISGATVTLSLNNSTTTRTATTGTDGSFSFAAVPTGTYTATANKTGLTMTPASRTVVVSTANVVGVNFVGATGTTTNAYAGNYTGRVTQTTNPTVGGADIKFTVAANGAVTGKIVFDADNSNTEYNMTGNVVLSSGSVRLVGSGEASGITITLTLTGALRASGTAVTGSGTALLETPFGSATGTWTATKGTTTPPATANFAGNYTGTYHNAVAGDTGPFTMTLAANGAARMTVIQPEGVPIVFTGPVNLTTGALTLTYSDSGGSATISGQLKANGTAVTGSGTFTAGTDRGTIALNKIITNPFAGRYSGTVRITGGPDAGDTAPWSMTVAADGSVSGSVDVYRFLGAINTLDGKFLMAQVATSDEDITSISGGLTVNGTSASGSATFRSANGNTGTISITR